jgi:hypothetical protein
VKRLVALLVAVLPACGGDSSGDDSAAAAAKCNDWSKLVCARAVECQAVTSAQACTDQLARGLVCGKTRSVSKTYDQCLDDTKGAPCDDLFPGKVRKNPASCENVFLQTSQRNDGY